MKEVNTTLKPLTKPSEQNINHALAIHNLNRDLTELLDTGKLHSFFEDEEA